MDFVFTREPCAGSAAKLASPLANFYLGSWKYGGHLPGQAYIPTVRHWLLPKHSQHCSRRSGLMTPVPRPCKGGYGKNRRKPSLASWDLLLTQAVQRFFPKTRRTQPPLLEALSPGPATAGNRASAQLNSTSSAQPPSLDAPTGSPDTAQAAQKAHKRAMYP